MAMAWETDCIELLRVLIDDMTTSPTYDNVKLKRLLVVAAYQINNEATFSQDFTVDIAAQTISPDPTDSDTLDENFVNLMCLKAACIMDRGAARKAAGKGIAGKDMNAVQFDLRGVSQYTIELLSKGYCAAYSEALTDYLYGNNSIGRAVMGPFRLYAQGYYPKNYSDY